ncbi:MAG: Uma2 family endonuclease [Tildeniella nuda ZEHNDER 1965/U140]|jgi:Uma2 family endonuclease|nr:Uma2 family endonuclease [Tildeniella nuda ZEHNDER 1965/U140]
MVQVPEKTLTLDAFLQLPETKPASEYIDGQIIQKPMPQGKHSRLQGELVTQINAIVKPQQVALAFPELRCTFGGRSIVPDIAVFTWSRIPLDDRGDVANVFQSAPDWTIEILSPDQKYIKVTKNILHCLTHGTQIGWLIDPEEQMVLAYAPSQQPSFFEEATDLLPVPAFAGDLHLTIGELFGWLKLGGDR